LDDAEPDLRPELIEKAFTDVLDNGGYIGAEIAVAAAAVVAAHPGRRSCPHLRVRA
jgi:hypothetical protein